MFSELSNGLDDKKFMTPLASTMIKAPGMIAEPAQVMVLMPGTRAEKAETALSQLKTYISIVSVCAIIVVLFGLYFWFRGGSKKPEYAGKTLPGISQAEPSKMEPINRAPVNRGPLAGPMNTKFPLPEPAGPINTFAGPATVEKPRISFEDIVHVDGRIPIWEPPEESTAGEKRVSENDESIANIIKAREALTKDIESYMSTGMKA